MATKHNDQIVAHGDDLMWFTPERTLIGQQGLNYRKLLLEYFIELANTQDLDEVELYTLACRAAVAVGGDISPLKAEVWIGFAHRLVTVLPKLRKHLLSTGYADYGHISAMERILRYRLDPEVDHTEFFASLDIALVEYFTPNTPHQALPTWRHLRQFLVTFLNDFFVARANNTEATADTSGEEPVISVAESRVHLIPSYNFGKMLLTAELAHADAQAIEHHLDQYAKKHQTTTTTALIELICGAEHPKRTTTVLFGLGKQLPNAEVEAEWIHGAGVLPKSQREELQHTKQRYHDALEIAQQRRSVHDPTRALNLLVILRDGTCRFPGCCRDATECDIDHVINYEVGGWTTLSNLQALCRHHHNMKTDRRIKARMLIDGTVIWITSNGKVLATTTPNGPLAGIRGSKQGITTRHSNYGTAFSISPPINQGRGRWGYTLNQRNRQHRKRYLRAPMPMRGIPLPEPPPEDEPPPDVSLGD